MRGYFEDFGSRNADFGMLFFSFALFSGLPEERADERSVVRVSQLCERLINIPRKQTSQFNCYTKILIPNAMITPDNQIPLDDSQDSDAEDQQSQQDIHSNGFDDIAESGDIIDEDESDNLAQAYDAAEPSYTLNLDDDDTSDDD